jgi:capsular exopolysaccharide synthesis family protein
VFEEPSSYIAEAFRSLRSRMQFFIKESKSPIILITSSMLGEGKTFIALNLASVFSLMGKKTVLLEFDMRKPKVYTDFGFGNENGISTWLIGKDELQNVIKETPFENLFIIPAGPIPPNPSELAAMEKTDELFILLKEEFDCIIIDSSPIGTVSDAFHIAARADISMLIVRQNMTLKDFFENTVKELRSNEIKSLSIVINDFVPEYVRYRHGTKYGYSYSKE